MGPAGIRGTQGPFCTPLTKGCPGGTERQSSAGLGRGDKGPTEEAAVQARRPSGHSIVAGSDPAMLGEGQGGPSGLSPPERGQGEQPGRDR